MNAKEAADKIRRICYTDFLITRTENGYVFSRYVKTSERRKVKMQSPTGENIEFEVPVYITQKIAEATTLPELALELEKIGCGL